MFLLIHMNQIHGKIYLKNSSNILSLGGKMFEEFFK